MIGFRLVIIFVDMFSIQNTYQQKKSIATISNFNPFPSDNVCMFSKSVEYPLFFITNSLILFVIQKIWNWQGCPENILKI